MTLSKTWINTSMANPKTVFIDADAFISLQFHQHSNYQKAIELSQKIADHNLQAITCTYTLLEVATVINMHFAGKRGPQVVQDIINNPHIHIIEGDKFLQKGLKIMNKQNSKNVSLNDCVHFTIVDKFRIDLIFSFDKHWTKNGYQLIK